MEKHRTEAGQPLWSALFSALRPAHWVKNLLVFVPVLLGHKLTDVHTLLRACAACGLLCLASSSAYLFNDILDAEADRRHPAKRLRPFARGAVSIRTGVLTGIVLATLAVSLGWLLGPMVSILLGLYLAGTLLYSKWLKQLLVVDMLLLASFYILRVFVGGVATDIRISFWTLLFCLFIFIGLATVKRYAEIHNRSANAVNSPNRRDYTPDDAAPLLTMKTRLPSLSRTAGPMSQPSWPRSFAFFRSLLVTVPLRIHFPLSLRSQPLVENGYSGVSL